MPRAKTLCLLLTLAFPLGALAEPLDPRSPSLSASARLEVLIQRIKQEQSKVKTLEAKFTQRQESEFLVAPEEAKGMFSYQAPDRVRWEYASPKPVTLVINGKTMTTWYRDLERAEEMKVGRYSERVLKYLGASGSIEALLEYFDVRAAFPSDTKSPFRLEMTPRYHRIAKRLKALTIWIDGERYLPIKLKYVSGDGAITEYSFDGVTVNGTLPGDRFELKLPDSVKVKVVDLDRAS